MKKINKHGLKIRNLKKVSGETSKDSVGYTQISYDMATGELFADWHYGSSSNSWTEYHDADVITVCNTRRHMTMQDIADEVSRKVNEERYMQQWLADHS